MMDFETLFADTLTDTVTLREPTATDMYGTPTFVGATTVTCPAWVSRKPRAVRTLGGEEKVSSAVIWLGHPSGGGEVPLPTTRCEVTLSDGSKPLILHVESITDPSGDQHVAVYCQMDKHEVTLRQDGAELQWMARCRCGASLGGDWERVVITGVAHLHQTLGQFERRDIDGQDAVVINPGPIVLTAHPPELS